MVKLVKQNLLCILLVSCTLSAQNLADEALNLLKNERKNLTDIRLIDIEDYDRWDQVNLANQQCAFVKQFDLTHDGKKELFLAGYSKKFSNAYLLIFSTNPLDLLKVQEFSHPQLCIVKSQNSLRVINKFGTEMEGDIIWDGMEINFVPYIPDY